MEYNRNNWCTWVSDIVYSYKKKPGWYPSHISGWTRLCSSIKTWDTEEEALNCAPTGCDVVKLYLKLETVDIVRG
ncbi:hypothetical protein LCGC14_1793520 [marine sediment metagenome]|uniref:Uncharacterized protein n=1 Tax=marine sediment metagenome TaxID=412755 RepID=A0A0F9GRS8_9ZZZZ